MIKLDWLNPPSILMCGSDAYLMGCTKKKKIGTSVSACSAVYIFEVVLAKSCIYFVKVTSAGYLITLRILRLCYD